MAREIVDLTHSPSARARRANRHNGNVVDLTSDDDTGNSHLPISYHEFVKYLKDASISLGFDQGQYEKLREWWNDGLLTDLCGRGYLDDDYLSGIFTPWFSLQKSRDIVSLAVLVNYCRSF